MTTPRRNAVDLHTHTARSDGVLPPLVLYEQMRAWGSRLVAVTDHDTLAGARELLAAGLGQRGAPGEVVDGPGIIVGVEINTSLDGTVAALAEGLEPSAELHVLGLGVDPVDAAFEARLEGQRNGRRDRLERTLGCLDALGLAVRDRLPEVEGGIDALGRPHVARALVAAGHAESVDDAFTRYLVPGQAAYVRRSGIGPRAAIEAITAAGGIASLAHSSWAPREGALIDRLRDWGLRAIEVYYPGWDEATTAAMAAFVEARALLATGGSDYHGDDGDYATAQAAIHVPPAVGERLLEALGAA
jgi:predicted metal-dependent phosphoesterase TrpH